MSKAAQHLFQSPGDEKIRNARRIHREERLFDYDLPDKKHLLAGCCGHRPRRFVNPYWQSTELGNGLLNWCRSALKNESSVFQCASRASLSSRAVHPPPIATVIRLSDSEHFSSSGPLCADGGQDVRSFPHAPFLASGALPRLRSDGVRNHPGYAGSSF